MIGMLKGQFTPFSVRLSKHKDVCDCVWLCDKDILSD